MATVFLGLRSISLLTLCSFDRIFRHAMPTCALSRCETLSDKQTWTRRTLFAELPAKARTVEGETDISVISFCSFLFPRSATFSPEGGNLVYVHHTLELNFIEKASDLLVLCYILVRKNLASSKRALG